MEKKPFCVLSVDGGGIRGIIPLILLQRLEEKLIEKSGHPEARLRDYFQLTAGTSTGAIILCMLFDPARPRLKAAEAVSLYREWGPVIFKTGLVQTILSGAGFIGPRFPARQIEKTLGGYFGATMLSEITTPGIITAYNPDKRYFHLFRPEAARQGRNSNPAYDYRLYDVLRASSAAPGYFPPALTRSAAGDVYTLIDGGVIANNPALCAWTEAVERYGRNTNEIMILSLGTGLSQKSFPEKKIRGWGFTAWAPNLFDLLMTAEAEVTHYQLYQLFRTAGMEREHYHRINILFRDDNLTTREKEFYHDQYIIRGVSDQALQMDNASPQNMRLLEDYARQMTAFYEEHLDEIARMLTA